MSTFDAAWRARALAGDPDAVEQLASGAALRPLYRFCLHRVGQDQHLCEEVVQETLLRALRDLERYDPARSDGRILPWLTGLARNEVRRVLAHRPALPGSALWDRLDDTLRAAYAQIEAQPLGEEHLAREETRDLVNLTMSQLPEHYREALEAKYVLGRSVRDMAALWRTSEKAVEARLTRARRAFRTTFRTLVDAGAL